ncbi:MAG: hypothetical protein AUG51_11110 [Acidobacteria bacterium 13_1_20CM_3_53_8]|nr:MAG: hypothetical protein AUG51_11110 [Acidobacteria bacterium 13_1_20CM_3_53_8]
MSRRLPSAAAARRRRRTRTLIWVAALAIITISLIYFEQTALLYILATLGVTVLLIVVAMADLAGTEKTAAQTPVPADDAAAIGSGMAAASTPTVASQKRTGQRR